MNKEEEERVKRLERTVECLRIIWVKEIKPVCDAVKWYNQCKEEELEEDNSYFG